jgi:hypothetical protein
MTIAIVADNVRPVSKYVSVSLIANATITAGDLVYHDGTGVNVCDDDASTATANCIGIAMQGASSGSYVDVCVLGEMTGWTGLTAGSICYVIDAGVLAHSAGTKTFAVGWATSTTNVFVNPNATVA